MKKDSILQDERILFDSISIDKSEDFIKYETQLEYSDSTFTELRGSIIAWNNVDSNFTQHINLREIMIFNPQIKRDSLELDSIVRRQKFLGGEMDLYEDISMPRDFKRSDKDMR